MPQSTRAKTRGYQLTTTKTQSLTEINLIVAKRQTKLLLTFAMRICHANCQPDIIHL